MWDTGIRALKMARKIKPNHGNGTKPYVWTEQQWHKKRRHELENELRMCWKRNLVHFFLLCSYLSMPWMRERARLCKKNPKWVAFTKATYFIWFDLIRFGWADFDVKAHLYERIWWRWYTLYVSTEYPPMRVLSVCVLCMLCVTACRRFWNERTKAPAIFLRPFISSYSSMCICLSLLGCVCVCVFFRLFTWAIRRQHVTHVLSHMFYQRHHQFSNFKLHKMQFQWNWQKNSHKRPILIGIYIAQTKIVTTKLKIKTNKQREFTANQFYYDSFFLLASNNKYEKWMIIINL